MSRRREIALGTLLLLVAPLLLSGAEGVRLTPSFAPGEHVRYRMHLTVETESTLLPLAAEEENPAPLRLAFDITWQLEALALEPHGAVQLRAVIEALQVEARPSDAWSLPTEDFVGKPITYRLLNDGSVDDVQPPDEWLDEGQPPVWLRTWLKQGSGSAAGLPPGPVVLGQQWTSEQEYELPGLPRQRLTSESTYLRDERVGEIPCARILTRFQAAGADRSEERGPADLRTTFDREVEGEGSRLSCYDHRSGRVLESSQTSREHIRLEIRQQPEKGAAPAPVVLESRTTTESHVRIVD